MIFGIDKTIKIAFFTMLLWGQTLEFHTTGHMIVARIAEIELEDSRIHQQMMDILKILSPFTKEKMYPFIEAATWADDIKAVGVKTMSNWHFSDTYIDGERRLTPKELTLHKLQKNPENLVWAINESKGVLRNKKMSLIDDRMNKSIYLRMLIHFFGDLHQPLHNVSFVDDDEFFKGDSGGNKFIVDLPGARNLHLLWDLCVKRCKAITLPLTKKNFDYIDSFARKLMNEFPRSTNWVKKRLKVTSVKEMSDESIQYAIDYVYKGIEHKNAPTKKYLQIGGDMIEQQILIAGYRLSDSLQKLFNDEDVLEPHIKTSAHENDDRISANII